ncbi:IS21-like element helper ATPase IstB [uncultured Acetobacterium sp.]|uniref:IS21-like element helper ATPase IstB n=1 Tax=uncultured Acetobacterium sp. TaxID=217139 RepID=UPI0026006662|nr:IS21-like element helper ATPase IstB [uncultured Acetobacterium sp.]MDP2812958.1 IS21-like element helper ATPase IstB [Erysipelotrichaceae bacterium]
MQQAVTESETYIEAKMKQFKLVDMREQYPDLIAEAEMTSMGYRDFLIRLLAVEEEGKNARRTGKLLGNARFELSATLGEIDYDFNDTLDKEKIEALGGLHFLDNHENIIVIGPPGVGKSMIATGIGVNACHAGRSVLFVNAKELVDTLHAEMLSGKLSETLEKLNRIELLIIDELSYIKMDKERESLFFQIIRQRYEKSSLIITTNLPMGKWDELFTGQLAATAILDRVLHHCHVLSITGDSYRVKGSKNSVNRSLGIG